MGASWIELHLSLRGHPKLIRFASMLHVSVSEATGLLINLWLFTATYAKDGNITKYSDDEIEAACMYERKGDVNSPKLVESLVECRWIDVKNSKKSVHSWKKYGMKLLEFNKKRVRKFREKKKLEEEVEHYGNVTVMATVHNITVHNTTLKELYTHLQNLWNDFAKSKGLNTIVKLNDKRKAGIRARLAEKEFNQPKIFEEIAASRFLLGEKDWKVDFDFVFCSANNYLKILEGKYRNGTNSSNGRGNLTVLKGNGIGGATTADDLRKTFEGTVFTETGTA